eukprot:TRINITY_DN3646_c0_g2_i1.p1 TRINITY_DN3646_c0_g2~~TRINITY_DN3646_c0_g2_i1.p1  ORF type:complete len:164 (-),score=37.16 TRINITY_DN3646_c0_g2_i1:200-691(-)
MPGYGRGVPIRINQGIVQQHSRGSFMRAMEQFGEVVYCRKPPYSDIESENYVDCGFATQAAADKALEEIKAGRVFVDGVIIGVGVQGGRSEGGRDARDKGGGPKVNFKQRHDERSPSPRTMARMEMAKRGGRRSRSRDRKKKRKKSSSSSSSSSSSRSKRRRR